MLDFDSQFDPIVFVEWLGSMEDFSKWYRVIDIEGVRFPKLKHLGFARKYWQHAQCSFKCRREPPITQQEVMKQKLKEKYLPTYFRN